jgi:mono/diheme cytochrome c family protein
LVVTSEALFRTAVITLLAGLVIANPGALAAESRTISNGKAIAIDACSACHRVTAQQKPPPPVFDIDEQAKILAPDFRTIARRRGTNPVWLRNFILAPRHPMREQDWNARDLKEVVAYIQSLRRQRAWK